jgi:hypothetical protein
MESYLLILVFVGVVLGWYQLLLAYPSQKKKLEAVTDEEERRNLKVSISILVVRAVFLLVYSIMAFVLLLFI